MKKETTFAVARKLSIVLDPSASKYALSKWRQNVGIPGIPDGGKFDQVRKTKTDQIITPQIQGRNRKHSLTGLGYPTVL